jgi:hypothetical protein
MSLATLELVKRGDFTTDQDVLDLLSYTDGFNLAMRGWDPSIMEDDQKTVVEALTLRLSASNDNNLAGVMQSLKEKRKETNQYKSGNEKYGVWLRAQLENESYARQALLDRMSYDLTDLIRPNRTTLENLTMALERYHWEDTAVTNYTGSSVSIVGGTFSYSNNVGDMFARLAKVEFIGVNGGGGPNSRFWLGFRSNRYGTPANFQSYWSLRKSSVLSTDTTGGTTNSDSDAKDGYKTITDFSTTESMAYRAYCLIKDVTSNEDDQRGRYQVLLRAKQTVASDIRVRLNTGFFGGSSIPKTYARVNITGANEWALYNMGTITIPGTNLFGGSEYLDNFFIGVEAERISGGGLLHMDCLVLIPIDEGFIYSDSWANVQYADSWGNPLVVYSRPNGVNVSYVFDTSTSISSPGDPQVFQGLPVGSGIGVLAGCINSITPTCVVSDVLNIDVDVYQRWEYLRGSET